MHCLYMSCPKAACVSVLRSVFGYSFDSVDTEQCDISALEVPLKLIDKPIVSGCVGPGLSSCNPMQGELALVVEGNLVVVAVLLLSLLFLLLLMLLLVFRRT